MKTTSWVGSYGTGNTRQLVDSYATHQFFVHKIPDDYVAETSRLLRIWAENALNAPQIAQDARSTTTYRATSTDPHNRLQAILHDATPAREGRKYTGLSGMPKRRLK